MLQMKNEKKKIDQNLTSIRVVVVILWYCIQTLLQHTKRWVEFPSKLEEKVESLTNLFDFVNNLVSVLNHTISAWILQIRFEFDFIPFALFIAQPPNSPFISFVHTIFSLSLLFSFSKHRESVESHRMNFCWVLQSLF